MPRPQRLIASLSWIALWIVVAFAGSFYIHSVKAKADAGKKLKQEFREMSQGAELAAKEQEDLSVFEQELKGKARAAEERRKRELDVALGGPSAAAFKNPENSIREALLKAATACAPTNCTVQIEIERFTEFTATVASDESISTNVMTAFARCYLPLAREYLSSLKFSVRGTLLAELDHNDIDLIEDWSRAPSERTAKLLAIELPAAPQDPNALTRIRQKQKIAEALKTDEAAGPKMDAAERRFVEVVREGYADLNSALSLVHKALSMDDVRKLHDLDQHEKDLRAARAATVRAKEFWTAPEKKWRALLEAENIKPETVNALAKAFPATFPNDPAKIARVFEMLDAKLESTRYFLRLAETQFGGWTFRPETGQYGFTDEEFGRRFLRAQQQAREDSQALEAALNAWNESAQR